MSIDNIITIVALLVIIAASLAMSYLMTVRRWKK